MEVYQRFSECAYTQMEKVWARITLVHNNFFLSCSMFACAMYWFFVITFFFNFDIIILVDRTCWLSGHNHLYNTQGHIIILFFIGTNSVFACFQMYVKSAFFLLFFFSTFIWFFFGAQTCVDSVGATIFTFPVVIQLNVFIAVPNHFVFLEKQNFLFTSFNLKEAMRLSSTHVMKMTWKQNKQSQKAFRRQNVQYSRKICLRLSVCAQPSSCFCLRSIQTYTTRTNMTFYTKNN